MDFFAWQGATTRRGVSCKEEQRSQTEKDAVSCRFMGEDWYKTQHFSLAHHCGRCTTQSAYVKNPREAMPDAGMGIATRESNNKSLHYFGCSSVDDVPCPEEEPLDVPLELPLEESAGALPPDEEVLLEGVVELPDALLDVPLLDGEVCMPDALLPEDVVCPPEESLDVVPDGAVCQTGVLSELLPLEGAAWLLDVPEALEPVAGVPPPLEP